MNGAAGDSISNPEALRNEGNDLFNHGRLHDALEVFTRSLFAEESHLTYNNRSLCSFKLGKYEDALKDAQRALKIQPTLKGHYRVASAFNALGRFDSAILACDEGLASGADNAELLGLRVKAEAGLLAMDTGESDSDDDDEDDDDEEDDEDEEDDKEEEDEYELDSEAEAERLASSSKARAKSIEPPPRGPPPPPPAATPKPAAPPPAPVPELSPAECKERGNVFYKAADYESSLPWYEKATLGAADGKEKALYLCNRAAALVMLGRVPEALNDAARASKLDPTSAKAFARMGKCSLQLGELTESRLALNRAAELSADTAGVAADLQSIKLAEALAEEATTHASAGEYAKAVSSLKLLSSRYCPHSDHFKFLELDAIVRMGKYDEVLSLATAMLRRTPDSPNALYLRGRCMFHNGQLDTALKHTIEALRLDPDHALSKELRHAIKAITAEKEGGNTAFKAGDYTEAVARYTAALALAGARDAIRSTLHVNRATAYARMRQHTEAIADCTNAIALDAKSVKAILRRAACYMELENFDKAIEDYELASQSAPDEEGQRSAREHKRRAKLEKAKASRIDHYKVLDIQKSASPVEVKKAYRKMALRWHPDKNAGSSESIAEAEAKFKEVNEAYDTLSDPAKKERYDSGVDLEAEVDGHHGHGHQHSHMDPEMFNMFRSFMGGQGGPGGGGGRRPGGGGDGGRGGGGGGRMPRSRFDF
mmetsp:Transcript_21180/g.50184  ORF Transcript_21180/g.50184 Transcript_21180/m.50184 type:complete len:713 (-) Transcript_21180:293-2431(-)